MALDSRKYEHKFSDVLRDTRPMYVRLGAWMRKRDNSFALLSVTSISIFLFPEVLAWADVLAVFGVLYFWWLATRDRSLPFKLPMGATFPDKNNGRGGHPGNPEGILYLGNVKETNEEVWFTNSDARTHMLYLGTTGAGKTEGLKSMVTNALCWGSGFVYVDGKADTDLWSSLSALCRRFGRDDDLLVLNYMTGNVEGGAPSNTMNPFSSGSSSYLVNMLTNLMPDAEGDNVMWKERAVSLVSAIMPALVWKRDNLMIPLFVTSIRDALNLNKIIALSREEILPEEIRRAVKGYLETLPGYQDAAFDDDGKQKPPGGDVPQVDMNTMSNQHGFLTMQLTRALQSLGEDYGYIFNTPHADVDMNDVVLNRRILVVLIPALEKSGDEIANLGKIIAANMKGMMGSALGATVEGDRAAVIDNKPAVSSTPFMTVFDEVGYYTAQGMGVMAAQARSLGFSLIFSGQDLPAMKKRVREEANSITANCNIKIFGKLEDPTETKEFFEKTVGSGFVTEVSGFQIAEGSSSYFDSKQASVQLRPRASYDGLREFKEGEAVVCFSGVLYDTQVFYSNPGHAKAMRVTRFLGLPAPDESTTKHSRKIRDLRDRLMHKTWTAKKAAVKADTPAGLKHLVSGLKISEDAKQDSNVKGIIALGNMYTVDNRADVEGMIHPDNAPSAGQQPTAQPEAMTSPFSKKPQMETQITTSGEDTSSSGSVAPPLPTSAPVVDTPVTPPLTAAPPVGEKPSIFGAGNTPSETPAPAAEPQEEAASLPVSTQTAVEAAYKTILPKEVDDILYSAANDAREYIVESDKQAAE